MNSFRSSTTRRVREGEWLSSILDDLVDVFSRDRAAERRWRRSNAWRKAEGCPCGGLAEVVKKDYRVTGSVPVETWTCREHEGVDAWRDGRPQYHHPVDCPQGRSTMQSGPNGQPPTRFYCEHRTHEGTT